MCVVYLLYVSLICFCFVFVCFVFLSLCICLSFCVIDVLRLLYVCCVIVVWFGWFVVFVGGLLCYVCCMLYCVVVFVCCFGLVCLFCY